MAALIRYTINRDGTPEKWYLEKDAADYTWLRKTPTPKYNCNLTNFHKNEVFASYRDAMSALKNI